MKRAVAATLGLAATMFVAVVGTSAAQAPKYEPITSHAAGEAGTVRPMVTDGHSFLEVNTAGELVRWTRTSNGLTFQRQVRGTGWHSARLITSLSKDRFVEIKTDGRLAEWNWVNGQYQQSIVGWGWEGSRAITGFDDETFLEIKPNNDLALWKWTDRGYQQTIAGTGWGTARLIAGLSRNHFVEVKTDGRLAEWFWENGRLVHFLHSGYTFNDIRLMAGSDSDHWVMVEGQGNAELIEYVWDKVGSHLPHVRGWGWHTARLLG